MQSAAGGTNQRLKPAVAIVRSLSRNPGAAPGTAPALLIVVIAVFPLAHSDLGISPSIPSPSPMQWNSAHPAVPRTSGMREIDKRILKHQTPDAFDFDCRQCSSIKVRFCRQDVRSEKSQLNRAPPVSAPPVQLCLRKREQSMCQMARCRISMTCRGTHCSTGQNVRTRLDKMSISSIQACVISWPPGARRGTCSPCLLRFPP